ncbi:hypothetical protein TNCV_1338561 [Trichonephila clavipes]|nr:hypothetical protein TNCV_1338561 [Trichonephila clavipes]
MESLKGQYFIPSNLGRVDDEEVRPTARGLSHLFSENTAVSRADLCDCDQSSSFREDSPPLVGSVLPEEVSPNCPPFQYFATNLFISVLFKDLNSGKSQQWGNQHIEIDKR